MERKQKEKKEKEVKELKSLKSAMEVWRFINKRRKKKVWREADISKEEWRDYFMDLLKGEIEQGEERNEYRKKADDA